jgi:hypothetical protein
MEAKLIFILVGTSIMLSVGGTMTDISTYGQQQQPKTNATAQQNEIFTTSTNKTTGWLTSFNLEKCNIASKGENSYFILMPGHQLILRGQEDNKTIEMSVTVLNDTKVINGTELGIVEEKSAKNGEIVEISKNYFGICTETDDVFYFGEDTDWYEGGHVVNHEGTWQAGVGDAKPGMIMPGKVKVGLKYYQELAPGLDEGRAEIVNINDTLVTPAGTFKQVLRTEETTPLEPGEKEYKLYAPGVGLIQDNTLKLVRYSSH